MKYFLYLFIVLFLALLVGWYAASQSGQVEVARSQAEQARYYSQVEIARSQAELEEARLMLQAELGRIDADLEGTRLELQAERESIDAEIARARLETWQEYAPIFALLLIVIMIVVAGVVATAVILAYLEDKRRKEERISTQLVIPGVLSDPPEARYKLASPTRPKSLISGKVKEGTHVYTR